MSEPMVRELTTLDEFYAVVAAGEGYVVITDITGSAIYHPPGCPSVDAAYFKEKVVVGKRRNGRYFWVANRVQAHDLFTARPCSCT